MKSSAYPPLDGLVDLACRDGVDVRPTLLRVLTDLFVQKPTHSSDEVTQYIELALGLVETVDDATRAAVAASLSRYPAAPPAVLAKLGVTSTPIPVKVEPEIETAPTVATEDLDTDNLVDLFFTAGSEDRRVILLNLDVGSARSAPARPVTAEVIRHLENVALQRKSPEFSRALSSALGISRALAERIARDPSGEPIVVAAKALGMKAAVLQRILLFLNPAVGQSVQRVYDLSDLFDGLSREAAEIMLAIWQGAGGAAASAREPIYQDSETHNLRAAGTRQPARVRNEKSERLRSTR